MIVIVLIGRFIDLLYVVLGAIYSRILPLDFKEEKKQTDFIKAFTGFYAQRDIFYTCSATKAVGSALEA